MKNRTAYVINALSGCFSVFLLYVIIIVINRNNFSTLCAVSVSILGIITGILNLIFFKRKFGNFLFSDNFRPWMFVVIQATLSIGILAGLFGGVLSCWFFTIPFFYFFGRPESGGWNLLTGYSFEISIVAMYVFSFFFFARRVYTGGVIFLFKKLGVKR